MTTRAGEPPGVSARCESERSRRPGEAGSVVSCAHGVYTRRDLCLEGVKSGQVKVNICELSKLSKECVLFAAALQNMLFLTFP